MDKKTIKELIKIINNYEVDCVDASPDKPFVIVGPSGNKWGLRIYCYGGVVGVIKQSNEAYDRKDLISPDFNKYLCRLYVDGKKQAYSLCQKMKKKYKNDLVDVSKNKKLREEKIIKDGEITYQYLFDGLNVDFLNILTKPSEIWESILNINNNKAGKIGRKYLDYCAAATFSKFLNGKESGERKVQTSLLKEYMGMKKSESNWIITDMEFCITDKERNYNHKPDLIVFDGKGFGLVELKYAGESMDKDAENSLMKHYIKFYNSIYESKNNIDIVKECLRRARALLEYELIDKSWSKEINDFIIPEKGAADCLWMGFLFVEGTGLSENDNEDYVKDQINIQLGEYFDENNEKYKKADVRYCYMKHGAPMTFDKKKEYIKEMIDMNKAKN